MQKKKIIIAAVLAIVIAIVIACILNTHVSNADDLQDAVTLGVVQQDPGTDDEGNVLPVKHTTVKTTDIVEIVDPFGPNNGLYPMRLTTLEGGSVNEISSVTETTVPDRQLALPNDLSKLGLNVVGMDSTKTIIMVQKMHFLNNADIIWNGPEDTTGNYTWEPHADIVAVGAGQDVLLTMVSKDHGKTWTAKLTV